MPSTASLQEPPSLGAALRTTSHANLTTNLWAQISKSDGMIRIDGKNLNMADVVMLSKGSANAALAEDNSEVMARIELSVKVLDERLARGETVYGVNTGYGGSADVRCGPSQMQSLQRAFLQHLQCGIIPTSSSADSATHLPANTQSVLKEEWVRAAMLIRANTVARGHSAVRASTIKALLTLLRKDVVPLIPTRGSISASGDLSPLSYVAGMLEGNPSIYCWVGPARQIMPANEALASVDVHPIAWEPKETLGLVNGTAMSCAVGCLTLSSMHNVFTLSQLLTAMNVEAMLGTATSFAPFISSIRPHAGQGQVAATILSSLSGSKLASPVLGTHGHTLFQDRYSLRTVPQWLGPLLEDLLLAHEQINVELNSTTDNPLIDTKDKGAIYHGGNFQATSVTSAMEKARLAAQAIGRMLFAQMTELFNPATNRGLPPNLCADDPSTSFTLKGVDTNMAAYMSELSYLANPVFNHVVTAEMGNQSLNSLGLVSARYTETAVDILRLMSACALYGNCQALDLRAMMHRFTATWEPKVHASTGQLFGIGESAKANVWKHLLEGLLSTTTMDAEERFPMITKAAKNAIISELGDAKDHSTSLSSTELLELLNSWADENAKEGLQLFNEVRDEYFRTGDASDLLGGASKRLYRFVRADLNVPMHRGVIDYPTLQAQNDNKKNGYMNGTGLGGQSQMMKGKKSIGQQISLIYEAIRSDAIMNIVVECLKSVD